MAPARHGSVFCCACRPDLHACAALGAAKARCACLAPLHLSGSGVFLQCTGSGYHSIQSGGGLPLAQLHLCLLAADVGEAAADTLDGGEGEHRLHLAVKVRVQHTQDVLEVGLVHDE